MSLHASPADAITVTKEMLGALGMDCLARLLLERASHDPGLLEQIRAAARLHPHTQPQPQPQPAPASDGRLVDGHLVGRSPAMRRVTDAIRKIAASDAPVLITGESGTGKELAASAIHAQSGQAAGPFIAINCAAIPSSLVASELFGHERGAFTGASQRRVGRIQLAEGGTLFLDEIGDLPLEMQAHLLRFLQEHTVDPVGGSHPITVHARVVAATNVPLHRAVAEGRFRQDLFYRLHVLTLEMPPLRAREGDAALLAEAFLDRFGREMDGRPRRLGVEARQLVDGYAWPGNVRELMAAARRAVVMGDADCIRPEDLGLPDPSSANQAQASLEFARQEVEEALVRKALGLHRGNIKRSAEHLGIARVTLYRLIEKYGIIARGSPAAPS
ncbi:MAG: sigma-54 dependent transcriptional regulator [Alphaproteobacteria bacterium]